MITIDHSKKSKTAGQVSDVVRPRKLILLWAIVASIGIFYALFAFRTFILRYYPSPPFIYDEGDTLADWLNTCVWSDRSDRYTAWQSLYTPFAHYICTLSNFIIGEVHPKWYGGWRQFSTVTKWLLIINIGFWLTIILPIKPFSKDNTFKGSLKRFIIHRFPFKFLTFLSYGALYSFERGNLLSISYVLFWLSFRAVYKPSLRIACQPILVGIAAAIKPYILMFSLYGRRWSGLVIALITVVVLQIIPVLLVGAPGIENLPANLDYFSRDNKLMDVVSRAVNSLSFKSYLDMKKLAVYGVGMDIKGLNFLLVLDTLYVISVVIFVIMCFLAVRCLLTSIKIDRHQSKLLLSISADSSTHAGNGRLREQLNSRVVLHRYAVPALLFVFVYMMISQSSGAYVVLFLLVPLLCIEEETGIVSSSPILLTLYFLAICAFDMPWLSAKAYECGIKFPLDDFRQIPLLSEMTGQEFTCMGTFVGPVSLARPFLVLLFACFLILKLRHLIQVDHRALVSEFDDACTPDHHSTTS